MTSEEMETKISELEKALAQKVEEITKANEERQKAIDDLTQKYEKAFAAPPKRNNENDELEKQEWIFPRQPAEWKHNLKKYVIKDI